MPDALWAETLIQLPIVAIVLGVVMVAVRHLDKWIIRWSDQQSAEAAARQQEIIVLLQQVRAEVRGMGDSLAAVVDRNTKVIDGNSAVMMRVAEAMAAIGQGQASIVQQLTEMNRVMLQHQVDVASRPCQMEAPRRTRRPAVTP